MVPPLAKQVKSFFGRDDGSWSDGTAMGTPDADADAEPTGWRAPSLTDRVLAATKGPHVGVLVFLGEQRRTRVSHGRSPAAGAGVPHAGQGASIRGAQPEQNAGDRFFSGEAADGVRRSGHSARG